MNEDRFSRNGRAQKSLAVARSATGYQKNEVDLRLDRLSDLWKNVENALLTRAPAREISVICDAHSSGDAYYETYILGIQRCAGKWRVAYECVTPYGRSDWRPIMECDRKTRVRMAKPAYIDQLRVEVDRTHSQIIPELDAAIQNLESALADLA
jgi:hypothetical protein